MADEKADANSWLAVAAGTVGSFMATLDSSLVNAALPRIQGEIGASETEGTWITTGYLVAEIVMIPLAGWLVRVFGLRSFLFACTVLFTLFSILCGLSNSLGTMILGRIGQGFTGGAMIPTALTIVATRLPEGQRPVGIALFGITAVFGPVFGPLVGGYLSEAYSWHYAFFINVPVGIGLLGLLLIGLPATPAKLSLFAEADWLGISGLALGLGAMTVVLEEGQRELWFESSFIVELSAVSVVGFVLLLAGQAISKRPVIGLDILLTRAFGSVFVLSLLVGGALYGISYILPQFLTALADYNPFQSGLVTLVLGVPSFLMMGFFPILQRLIDIRFAVGFGLILYALGCFMNAHLTNQFTGETFLVSLILIGFAQFFTLIFLNSASTSAVSQEREDDASGLFNAARNLGGSIGLAFITTMRERRTDFHAERLAENLSSNRPEVQAYVTQTVSTMGRGDPVAGMSRTYRGLEQIFQVAGTALAFADVFLLFGIAMLAALPLALLLKPIRADAGPA